MTANADKDFIEKIYQQQEEQHKKIQQHFEKRWQEARDEFDAFFKDIFMFGCNVGWNDCYKFHEDVIQKGLNKS